jgi:hypothetical protein
MTYTARLNRKINGAARVRFISVEMQAADRLNMIRAKATAFIQANPQPRATFPYGFEAYARAAATCQGKRLAHDWR